MRDARPPAPIRQALRRPFWNAGEQRLRAGWRLLGQLLLFGLLSVATFALWPPATGLSVAGALGTLIALLASVWLAARLLDRRAWADYGLHLTRRWWADLGFGLLLGALLMSAIFLIEWGLGWVTVEAVWWTTDPATPFWRAILTPVVVFVAVGIYEELWTRGYQLRNLAEGLHGAPLAPRGALLGAWLLTALFFGLLHAGNPNATVISTLSIALAGILLGLGYVLTGELAIPIGLHISWNLFQGNVFGFAVSGTQPVGAGVLAIVQGGPPRWTGGPFGPEAGLLGIGALIVGCLLTVWYVRLTTGSLHLATALTRYTARRPAVAATTDQSA